MTTYNTGNPLGSPAVKDLYDNAENFDRALNDPIAVNWTDRLGKVRLSWTGMDRQFRGFLDASSEAFQQFLISSGYEDIGDYAPGLQITSRNQIFRKDGELYRAGAALDLPYTTSGDWGTEGASFVSVGDAALRQELSYRLPVDVLVHGAVGDGTTINDAAFQSAELASDVIYVPEGEYRLSTPMALGYTAAYYGPGVLKFDNAEWWRRGGSSGSPSVQERYTLFYEYEGAPGPAPADNGISITFDGVAQPITWLDKFTVLAPGSTTSTAVIINILNGRLRLGPTPEQVRSYNAFGSGGHHVQPSLPSPTTTPVPGMNNVSDGPRTLMNLRYGANNTGYGSRVLTSLEDGENNTGMGFQVLYRAKGSGNSAFGSIALEWLTTGNDNSAFGLGAGGGVTTGSGNSFFGVEAGAEAQAISNNCAFGQRALGNGGPLATYQNCVAMGTFAMDFNKASSSTGIGYRSLNGELSGGTTGEGNTALGAFTGRFIRAGAGNLLAGVAAGIQLRDGSNNTLLGYESGNALTNNSEITAGGYQALKVLTTGIRCTAFGTYSQMTNVAGDGNTTVGWSTMKTGTGANNTVIGARGLETATTSGNVTTLGAEAGHLLSTGSAHVLGGYRAGRSLTTGNDSVALGADALQFETTGSQSTAIGRRALRLLQDGTNHLGISNATGLGFDAAVSGSNQVQLGNSATTTYVYGTVQSRSDQRDKSDIRGTVLGLEFIKSLRPVDYRWDMREDYTQEYEEEVTTNADGQRIFEKRTRRIPKDGSKKRERYHHGLIAQEVKEVADRLGVDFGGFQDHTVNGGCDVQSLGYDEFIAPLIRAVQQLAATNEALMERVAVLEARP